MKRYLFPVALALSLAATLETCTYTPGYDTARRAIEDHVRAVGPDVVPATLSFDVNELVQHDKNSWEARFGAGLATGAMLIRRTREGWVVEKYIGEPTLDFMASIATEQWLAQREEVASFSSGSVTPASAALTTGSLGERASTYDRFRAQLAVDHVLRP